MISKRCHHFDFELFDDVSVEHFTANKLWFIHQMIFLTENQNQKDKQTHSTFLIFLRPRIKIGIVARKYLMANKKKTSILFDRNADHPVSSFTER